MARTKRPDSKRPEPRETISPDADAWIRQFVTLLEDHFIEASRNLPSGPGTSELQLRTARAILATYRESGMELESVVELLGQAAAEETAGEIAWSDELNQRRFELIDKEIQGSLTLPEWYELARLTGTLRKHVDSEANLPTEGARALHAKLLQLTSLGESE